MPQIFISYSRKDTKFVDKLNRSLQTHFGADTWLDRMKIHGGDIWSDEIQKALDECFIMILVVSPESATSKEVFNEWHYFLTKKKEPIIPAECVPADLHYRLHPLQKIFFHDEKKFYQSLNELRQVLINFGATLGPPIAVEDDAADIQQVSVCKPANIFWISHDLVQLFDWLSNPTISKIWLDIGLNQSLHHAREIKVDQQIIDRLDHLVQSTKDLTEEGWNTAKRAEIMKESKTIFNLIAQEMQSRDPHFKSSPD